MSQNKRNLIGAGGKPKQQTRTNTADNLFSRDKVELVLALGEGPIEGLVTPENLDPLDPGEVDFRSFFVGTVPLQRYKSPAEPAADNFVDLSASFYPGSDLGETVVLEQGGQSNTVDVGTVCTQREPLRRLTPPELRGRIKRLEIRLAVTQLYIETESGTYNNTLLFNIEYKKSRAPDITYTKVQDMALQPVTGDPYYDVLNQRLNITGKTSSGWVRDFLVELPTVDPDPEDDWEIRVTKISPDYDPVETATKTLAEFTWESMQCVTQLGSLTHNNLAMIRVRGKSSDQFSSLPDFWGIYKGLIITVSQNYDPNTIGNGAFSPISWDGVATKQSWTNNPAWVLHDLVMNPRYGLRAHSPSVTINKADVYQAAIYCNEPVVTGDDEIQKRYTFNTVLSENVLGREMLEYVAGSFDAVLFDDGNGQLRVKVDRWEEPYTLVTPECILPDGFQYSFTEISSRPNDITVSFLNPKLGYVEDRRNIKDDELISKNGRVPMDFVAVGCTNEDEAIRRAWWRLLTANLETTMVSFTTTRLGYGFEPYEIIWVADSAMGWSLQTGRIEEAPAAAYILLRDALFFDINDDYVLHLQTYTGVAQYQVRIHSYGSNRLNLVNGTLPAEVRSLIPQHAAFALTPLHGQFALRPFRVLAVEETEADSELIKISASEVSLDKYNHPLLVINNKRIINLSGDLFDLNLYNEFFTRFGAPYLGLEIEFRLMGDMLITSTSTTGYAVDTGVWPAGVIPKLVVNQAKIAGRGGKGGRGGIAWVVFNGIFRTFNGWSSSSTHPDRKGQPGGTAIRAQSPLVIDLTGHYDGMILGGGGGGAGSAGVLWYSNVTAGAGLSVAGSGGGGGWPYGEGGARGFIGFEEDPTVPNPGGYYWGLRYHGGAGNPGSRTLPGEGGATVTYGADVDGNGFSDAAVRVEEGGRGGDPLQLAAAGVPPTRGSVNKAFGSHIIGYNGLAGAQGKAAIGGAKITFIGRNTNNVRGTVQA